MVSQPENRLDFAHIMDSGKIFLAKLPEGLLGRENSYLLGTLLVSKFQQIAMSRQAQQIAARRDYWIYIDEFANFITPSMAEILKGTRKYRVGLTLAHQELHQLQRNSEVASAVMSHPFTRIVFRVGDDDAKKLAEGFSFFEAKDLRNLETGQAICKVERSDFDFNLTVPFPDEPDATTARWQEVIAVSREKYGTTRADVEAMLAKSRGSVPMVEPRIAPSVAPPQTVPRVSEVPTAATLESDEEESQHNAIKERIRVQAETLDYSVTFEETVPGGQGRADVVLRRGNHSIACEITVTTPVEYEVANLTKCLKADFRHVAAISRNRKKLSRIQELLSETATPEQIARVGFYLPEEFISKLHDWAMKDPEGATLEQGKPRKRKIAFDTAQLTEGERRQREVDMLKSLAEAMKPK
ncbi:MAG TPA: hypothetical protein VMD27_10825, partial [Candidatus Aquilonibacter sp.]|nr:hypothetical protein [Candidatus Aquilonibacter sp.]